MKILLNKFISDKKYAINIIVLIFSFIFDGLKVLLIID